MVLMRSYLWAILLCVGLFFRRLYRERRDYGANVITVFHVETASNLAALSLWAVLLRIIINVAALTRFLFYYLFNS